MVLVLGLGLGLGLGLVLTSFDRCRWPERKGYAPPGGGSNSTTAYNAPSRCIVPCATLPIDKGPSDH